MGRISKMRGGGGAGEALQSNGGIMGSGIFGMFGSTVVCKADDTSAYCMLSKTVNIIMMVIYLILIVYLAYTAFKYFFGSSSTAPAAPQQMTGGYIVSKSKSKSGYRSKNSNRSKK
jgi:hypothetical protein